MADVRDLAKGLRFPLTTHLTAFGLGYFIKELSTLSFFTKKISLLTYVLWLEMSNVLGQLSLQLGVIII
jgi:hypothetical protein